MGWGERQLKEAGNPHFLINPLILKTRSACLSPRQFHRNHTAEGKADHLILLFWNYLPTPTGFCCGFDLTLFLQFASRLVVPVPRMPSLPGGFFGSSHRPPPPRFPPLGRGSSLRPALRCKWPFLPRHQPAIFLPNHRPGPVLLPHFSSSLGITPGIGAIIRNLSSVLNHRCRRVGRDMKIVPCSLSPW